MAQQRSFLSSQQQTLLGCRKVRQVVNHGLGYPNVKGSEVLSVGSHRAAPLGSGEARWIFWGVNVVSLDQYADYMGLSSL